MDHWIVTCPKCGTKNEVQPDQITVQCGQATCTCTCVNCSTTFEDHTEYWRWLGLESAPPAE